MVKNIFISTYAGEWISPATVLKDNLAFQIVELNGKKFPSIASKKSLLKMELHNTKNIIRHWKEINHSNVIICSNYVMLVLLLFRKLHLLKCRKLIWYGVYIHSPGMISLGRRFLHAVLPKGFPFKIVVFSRSEINLYTDGFNLPRDSFIYLPYGEWNKNEVISTAMDEGYFFAGGYSNRDYISLVKVFMGRKEKLIIAASKQNTDFAEYVARTAVTENITLFWDIPAEQFKDLLVRSHAVVLAMKHNTGASGQMVMLRAMQYRKLIIATHTAVICEYIENQSTGIVVDTIDDGFAAIIQTVSSDEWKDRYNEITQRAFLFYSRHHSYTAIAGALTDRIKQEI